MRTIPIRRVGNRDNLFLGGDREIVMVVGVACFGFGIESLHAALVCLVVWCATLYLARLAGKKDARLRDVYLRHRTYAAYYPARSTPFRRNGWLQARRYR